MDWNAVMAAALAEDVGSGDATTRATVDGEAWARGTITQKADGVIFGLDGAQAAFAQLDPQASVERLIEEGRRSPAGTDVLTVTGKAAALLTAERTALNLLAHLSGIATLTARFVSELEDTGVRVLDTRKTTPGLRLLEKAAVAVLIKENHIAAAGGIEAAVTRARAAYPDLPLEVECRDGDEVDQALAVGAPRILLDNMSPRELEAMVARVGGRAVLEASGGITLETIRAHAVAGLDFISVGALTHSAPALDLSLILEALP
jgi:nicotinate-nucleotide pyrophosphorylase (carboxylating)